MLEKVRVNQILYNDTPKKDAILSLNKCIQPLDVSLEIIKYYIDVISTAL